MCFPFGNQNGSDAVEQKPMNGSGPLEPPSADVARLYLEEADAVEQRREQSVDRRAVAWRSIATAAITAAMLAAFLLVLRVEDSVAPSLLFLLLLTSQISVGLGERGGLQWRTPQSGRWYLVIVVLFGVAVLGTFLLILLSRETRPIWMSFVPGAIMLVGFGGIGVRQLWMTRGAPVVRSPREPLPLPTRIATASLGVLMGVATISIGIDDLAASLVTIVLMFVLVGWFIAWRTDAGPAALGRYWRWPQFLAYTLAAAVVVWANLQTAYSGPMAISSLLLGGALAAALLIGAAIAPDPRGGRGA